MTESLLEKFIRYIREKELFATSDRILLTVSGGVDSMVMMDLMVKAGYTVGVAHCNFQLRGDEAVEDETLVASHAAALGVPHYNKRFDTAAEMERTGESVQIAARRLRYEWFDELCDEHGYNVVAIAHQADDSIETFFINLFRGTGLKGLTGISVMRDRVVRPLLFAPRKEISEYALAHKVPFREDSSNKTTKYLRNKIRLGLVPRIREINPKFTELMRANLGRLIDAQRFIDRTIESMRADVQEQCGDDVVVYPDRIPSDLPLNFVIYELLNSSFGFKGDVVEAMCRALKNGAQSGKKFYSRDKVACIDRGRIVISPIDDSDTCEVKVEKFATRAYCGNSVLYMEWLDVDNIGSLQVPDNVALVDADRLEFPLSLRRWSEGDAFIPLGMTGRKKVSDYLIDHKVAVPEKKRQFVMTSGENIVWLVGRRVDDRYKITPHTENVLKITREII